MSKLQLGTKTQFWAFSITCGVLSWPLLAHAFTARSAAPFSPTPVLNAGPQEEARLTIDIDCSDQNIVDQPHQVTVTACEADPAGTDEFTVTVDVARYSTACGVAGMLESAMEEHAGGDDEVEMKDPADPELADTAKDLCMPDDGSQFKSVQVKKRQKEDGPWHEDDGHLKAFLGGKKISNQNVPGTSIPLGFSQMEFENLGFNADPLSMRIRLVGTDMTGAGVEYVKRLNYPNGVVPVTNFFQGMGNYLSVLGMSVTYPTYHTMEVDIGSADFAVHQVYFGLWENTNGQSPDTSDWEFRFEAD